jgi:hypothetical protein
VGYLGIGELAEESQFLRGPRPEFGRAGGDVVFGAAVPDGPDGAAEAAGHLIIAKETQEFLFDGGPGPGRVPGIAGRDAELAAARHD